MNRDQTYSNLHDNPVPVVILRVRRITFNSTDEWGEA
jgi:hypothetical protein